MAWSCKAFAPALLRRDPFYDADISKDWFPSDDAFIGQTKVGVYEPQTGDSHTWDRLHVAFPNLSGCWTTVNTQTCIGEPCQPNPKVIGWGESRFTYSVGKTSFKTAPLCFDQINTIQKANYLFAQIIKGLREITKQVQSDRLRTQALFGADTIYIAGSSLNTVTIAADTFGAGSDCTTVRLGSNSLYPTSKLTMPYLMNFVEPLQFAGYFRGQFQPAGIFKLITDFITARDLREGNPGLQQFFRFADFQKGGELYKYGIQNAVGNFGFAIDPFPMRFYPTNDGFGGLQRVFPYTNVAATIGVKPQISTAYLNAPIQLSLIWHPETMEVQHSSLRPVSSEMPFLVRDLMGKWSFLIPDVIITTDPATGTQCTIDNAIHNQGYFFADFQNAIKHEYPQWRRAILHLREPQCVVDQPNCSTAAAYAVQDYNSQDATCADESGNLNPLP